MNIFFGFPIKSRIRGLRFILYSLFFLLLSFSSTNAAINFNVSPIKYEINTSTGSIITKTAKLSNITNNSYFITTGKSDFQSNGISGNPEFVRKSELVFPDQELSTWITIDTPNFNLGPKEIKEVNFTIDVPVNATPGGHYGAVFFKNQNNGTTGNNVGVNLDYGILVLVNVDGEVTSSGSVGPIVVVPSQSGGGRSKDNCPYGDLTVSRYDDKCIDDFFEETDSGSGSLEKSNSFSGDLDDNNKENDDFRVGFVIPFDNNGNTHIKPTGKIKLVDENGNQIKGIGKEILKSNRGVVVGEKIVDYIPINDIGGNVLPGTKRNFDVSWEGFPYKDFDEEGNNVIKYWNPSDYYSNKNKRDSGYLMPWERVEERLQHKKIKAYIDLGYDGLDGSEVSFSSAPEFYVDYTEKYIALNPYFIIPAIFFIFILVTSFFIFGFKKRRCKNKKCRKKYNKKYKVCPYCGEKR